MYLYIFLGYDGYPNFFESLMKCIIQTITTHDNNRLLENCPRDGPLADIHEKYSQSNCPGVDQDDSGFDTSDSSDEKKKHLNVKGKSR